MDHDAGATPVTPSPPPAPTGAIPRVFARIRAAGLIRPAGAPVAGVCAGLALRSGWNVAVVRVLFVAFALMMGSGLVVYGLAWLLMPDHRGTIPLEDAVAGRFHRAFMGGVVVILAGLPSGMDTPWRISRAGSGPRLALTATVIAAGWVLLQRRRAAPASPPGNAGASIPPPARTTAPSEPVAFRPGAGRRLVLTTLGLAALTGVTAHLAGVATHHSILVAVRIASACAVVVIGLGVVVAGVRGQRLGSWWLAPVALLLPVSLVQVSDPRGPGVGNTTIQVTALGDRRIWQVGDVTLDLRRAARRHVGRRPASLVLDDSIGDVVVDYPADLTVDVTVHRIGDVRGGPSSGRLGPPGRGPDLRLQIHRGVGDVTFREVAR